VSVAGFFVLTGMMGMILYNREYYRLAEQWYTCLLRFYPGEVSFWLYRANARRQLQQDQDALADYYEALNVVEGRTTGRKAPFAIAVDFARVHGELGSFYLNRGQYQKAVSECTVALSKSLPTLIWHRQILHTRILAYHSLGDVAAALPDMEAMRAMGLTDPQTEDAFKSLAW
jgi:tetratricopeptide (TPR) repeat protein